MRSSRTPTIALSLTALLGLGLAACGDDAETAASDGEAPGTTAAGDEGGDAGGGTLTVYSGRDEELIGPLLEDFATETGIDVEVRYGSTAEMALLIETEGDRSPADVFISQSPGAVGFLEDNGLLGQVPEETLDLVATEDHAEDGSWVGLTGRVRTLVYNTDNVTEDELPDSVLDLVDPAFADRIGVAPGNGSFQDFVSGMRVELGDDETTAFLEGLAANDPTTYDGNTAILEAVGRGEVDFGLINHYYKFQELAEGVDSPTALHFFEPGDLGGLILVSAASIVATNDAGTAAEDLVAFLLSEESQTYFAEETQEYPLIEGVEASDELPPLDETVSLRIDFEDLGGLDETEALIQASGLDG